MKKYVFVIILIGVVLGTFLVIGSYNVVNERTKSFDGAGYILQSAPFDVENATTSEGKNIERYYFGENSTYVNKYDDKIKFEDIDGNDVLAGKNNFIHYNNDSISSLSKGVILNLEDIDNDPIIYYNIGANKVLKYQGGQYVISHINTNLEFVNFIYKISENKYLIASDDMKIHFSNGEIKEIDGYIELEYLDNEIVSLYNQEVKYQTISSSVNIEMPNEITINLERKLIRKKDETKLSLENMVIDSDDNIEIKDFDDEDLLDENQEEGKDGEGNGNGDGSDNGEGGNGIIGAEDAAPEITENNATGNSVLDEQSNDEYQEEVVSVEPIFTLEEFETNSLGFNCKITIEDTNNVLTSDHEVSVIENSSGKVVYVNQIDMSRFEEEISVLSLNPDTEYTLAVDSSYKLGEFQYNKRFINKVFVTDSIGIGFEKDCFTDTSLKFKINIDELSKFKSADIILYNTKGEVVQSYKIDNEDDVEDTTFEFTGLIPNTEYKLSIENVLYGNQVIERCTDEPIPYKTLKRIPEIGTPYFEINKRNGTFELSISGIEDEDNGISKYRYEIYEAGNTEGEEAAPVAVYESTSGKSTSILVDNVKLYRETGYVFKVIVEFYDNEKYVEYESPLCEEVMKLDGVPFPILRFEESEVTFEAIRGKIIIEDEFNTINLNSDPFTITYTDSVGTVKQFNSAGNLVIPVNVNYLRANETYRFAVYATVDLSDGNAPIKNCYIGSVIVKTADPKPFVAVFHENEVGESKDPFQLEFQLTAREGEDNTLEAQTLTSIVFNLYAGQSIMSSPVKTIKLVDRNNEPYISELKDKLYNDKLIIDPKFFGAQPGDFKEKYYTLKVTQAYDYTEYPNNIPIYEDTFTFESVKKIEYPTDPEDAMLVIPIKNKMARQYKDITAGYREDLDPETVVGYSIDAGISDEQIVNAVYYMYDAETKEVIKEIRVPVGEDGETKGAVFEIFDGIKGKDGTPRRGNSYYFEYKLELDTNGDGEVDTTYPYVYDDIHLRSKTIKAYKQEPKIEIYQSSSGEAYATFKYRCSDIDQALEENKLNISNEGATNSEDIEVDFYEEYKSITFDDLLQGNLILYVDQRLMNNEAVERKNLIANYFEGTKTIDDLTYNVSVEGNNVKISLSDSPALDRIAAYYIEFESDGETQTTDLMVPKNRVLITDLNEISDFINKNVDVNLYAYYDNGSNGFDMRAEYYTLQKNYLKNESIYYYYYNEEGNLTYYPEANGNIYKITKGENEEGEILSIDSALNDNKGDVPIEISDKGYLYNNDAISLKPLKSGSLRCTGSKTIKFEFILPGISMEKPNGDLKVDRQLDLVRINPDLTINDKIKIKENKIYIEVYKTDSAWKNESYVKTVEATVDEFEDKILIDELEAKCYYFIRFKAKLLTESGEVERYLYDVDQAVVGRKYYFNTLADIKITDVSVKYNPVLYGEKTVDISFNLDIVLGYQKIKYTLFKDEGGTFKQIYETEDEEPFTARMVKQIDARPGGMFEFGKKYKVRITTIAIYDGDREVPITSVEHTFNLTKLSEPIVAMKGVRRDNDIVDFKISVYDQNERVVKDDKYTIAILDENGEDITPDDLKQEYITNLINNTVTINGIDQMRKLTLKVFLELDLNNDGQNITRVTKEYVLDPINQYGISLGKVSTSPNQDKIDIIFSDSYNLIKIDTIRYTIYNTSGFAKNAEVPFNPKRTQTGEDSYYVFTLNDYLEAEGIYMVQIQYLTEGTIVAESTLEYIYNKVR